VNAAHSVAGRVNPKGGSTIELSVRDSDYHRKGLGLAFYEAAMAHEKNALGARMVFGGAHSSMASRPHARLAAKHGMAYKAKKIGPDVGAWDDAYGPYAYALKGEMDPAKVEPDPAKPMPEGKDLEKMNLTGTNEKPAKRKHLHLPVGTVIDGEGRFKVQHNDGSESWKQGRAGVIMSQDPTGHPTSSREPNAR
jgi:hypothetical protein